MHTYKIFRTDFFQSYNKEFSDYVLNIMYPGVISAGNLLGDEDDE